MKARADIASFFAPRAVALVGPVRRGGSPESVLGDLRRRWGEGFHLVDPAGGVLGEVPVHTRLEDVPAPIDLAVLDVPSGDVLEVVNACGRSGVRFLIVSSSGFAELDAEGAEVEQKLVAAVHAHGMRMLGPNANANCFDAMPPPANPSIGRIGLITQSGHMGRVIAQASDHGVAFSRWVPTGNEADLEAADFIEYFAHDAETAVIAGYFEGFRDAVKLRAALDAAAEHGKPVVVIKVGRHESARRMATSHTAHLAGSDAAVDGLFKQYGVIRVHDVDELIETAALCAKIAPVPAGSRAGLYGISGGALALMADHAEAEGVEVPLLADETQRELHSLLPKHLGVGNPVDNGNLYRTGTKEQRTAILGLIEADPSVDVVVCALTGFIPKVTDDFTEDILELASDRRKPLVVTWNTWQMESDAYAALVRSGLPIFRTFRGCFRALAAYLAHRARLAAAVGRPLPDRAVPGGGPRRTLDPGSALALFGRHGIPLVEERLVDSADEARAAAESIGGPVAMKVLLDGFPHKSDVGLVLTDLRTADAVAGAFAALRARAVELSPGIGPPPVLVQRQVGAGVELIVGVTVDEEIGKVLLVGLGGIHTEVTRDVSVRPLPVTRADVGEMLRELRGHELLLGVRGSAPVNLEAVEEVVLGAAALAADPVSSVVELDLNPVIAGPADAVVVDSLVIVAVDADAS